VLPDILKNIALFEGSQVLPVCPSDKSSVKLRKIFMGHWWNDSEKETPKYWEKNLSHCQLVQHKPHTIRSMIEQGPPVSFWIKGPAAEATDAPQL
jgi:hypothetical protein